MNRSDTAGLTRAMGVSGRPRNLLFVVTDMRVGGAETMLSQLVTAEPRLADEITVVSLLPGGPLAERLRAAGVEVVEQSFDTVLGVPAGLFRLAKLIARAEPDIVQGWMYHGDLAALLALAISGRRKRTRLAWSIRCSDLDFARYRFQLRLVVKACTLFSRIPDMITVNSKAGLRSHLALGYRPRRSEVVANGVDVVRFQPDPAARAAVRSELGLSPESIVLAHVARVDPMKDHAAFVASMDQLPAFRALLIGLGTEQLPDRPNLLRLGRRDDVARLLAAADFVVSSSAFGEGFSNALAEGMACGLPAIATDVGDARMIVADTGMIVPPRDPHALASAIRALAAEAPAARAQRKERARARIVDQFSLARSVERFSALYRSLLAPPAGAERSRPGP